MQDAAVPTLSPEARRNERAESNNVDDLVVFLRAQLDEDEAVARRAFEYASPVWHLDEHGETVLWWPPEPHVAENERKHGLPVTADQWRGLTIDAGGARIGPHIARHDPARVLREIEAKREMIDECAGAVDEDSRGMMSMADRFLRMLALPYAEHPHYREEWKP